MRPSALTGDAEKFPLRRSCQTISPVSALRQLATPPSVVAKRYGFTYIIEGTFGIPFRCSQTRFVSFKSPSPPSRKALIVSLPPQPPEVNASPSPTITDGTFPSPITSLDQTRRPLFGSNPCT